MKISFATIPGNLNPAVGYGYAGYNMVLSLKRLGHEVPFRSELAPVQIFFSQPEWYEFADHQYKIGYTPWESTGLPDGWVDRMNDCDEVWTPSPVVANWYRQAGVEKPITVYRHGIEDAWTPLKREVDDKFRFLHVGEPAIRKGGDLVARAFRAAFGDSEDVELVIKAHNYSFIRVKGPFGPVGIEHRMPNVKLITREMPLEELVWLYHHCHTLVYPSYGEGFGFIPLQALATGMPTICTGAWAPYRNYLGPLYLGSRLADSPWPDMHPGKMFHPDFDQLVELMRDAVDRQDSLSKHYFEQAPAVRFEYDWDRLTERAWSHIVNRFG